MHRQESASRIYGYKKPSNSRTREEEQYYRELKEKAQAAAAATPSSSSWAATYLQQEEGPMSHVIDELKKKNTGRRKKKKSSSRHHAKDEYREVNQEVMKMQEELKQRIKKRRPEVLNDPLMASLYGDNGEVKTDRKARLDNTKQSILDEIRRKSTRRSKKKSSSSSHDDDYGLLGSTKSNVLEELKKRSKKKKRKPSRTGAVSVSGESQFSRTSHSTDGGSFDDDDAYLENAEGGSTYSRSARHDEEGSRESSSRRSSTNNNNNNSSATRSARGGGDGRRSPAPSSSARGSEIMEDLGLGESRSDLIVPGVDGHDYDYEVPNDDGYEKGKSRFFQDEDAPAPSRIRKAYLLDQYDYGNSNAASQSKTKDFLHSELKKRFKSPSRSRTLMYKYGNYSKDDAPNGDDADPNRQRRSSLHQELQSRTASRRSPRRSNTFPSHGSNDDNSDEDEFNPRDDQRRSSLHQELQSRTASRRSPTRYNYRGSESSSRKSHLHKELKSRREPRTSSEEGESYRQSAGDRIAASKTTSSRRSSNNDSDGNSSLNDHIRKPVQRITSDEGGAAPRDRPRRGTGGSYYIPGITARPKTDDTVETEETTDDEFGNTTRSSTASSFFIPGINGTARCLNGENSNAHSERRRTSSVASAGSNSSGGSGEHNASISTGLSARSGATRSSTGTNRSGGSRRTDRQYSSKASRRNTPDTGAPKEPSAVDLEDIIRGARTTKNFLSSPTKSNSRTSY